MPVVRVIYTYTVILLPLYLLHFIYDPCVLNAIKLLLVSCKIMLHILKWVLSQHQPHTTNHVAPGNSRGFWNPPPPHPLNQFHTMRFLSVESVHARDANHRIICLHMRDFIFSWEFAIYFYLFNINIYFIVAHSSYSTQINITFSYTITCL